MLFTLKRITFQVHILLHKELRDYHLRALTITSVASAMS